jgi:hypothetical protein
VLDTMALLSHSLAILADLPSIATLQTNVRAAAAAWLLESVPTRIRHDRWVPAPGAPGSAVDSTSDQYMVPPGQVDYLAAAASAAAAQCGF